MSALGKSFLVLASIPASRDEGGDDTVVLTLVQVIVALNIASVIVPNKKLKNKQRKSNNIVGPYFLLV